MSVLKRAFALNSLSRAISFVSNLVFVVVVSRILNPEEIGIYSVSMSIVSIIVVVREFGAAQYIFQKKDLTTEVLRSVLGIICVVSWSCGIVIFAAAGQIADFYSSPEMTDVIRVISINFFLVPLLGGVFALLRRKMQFGRAMAMDLINSTGATVAGIALAFMGYGVMSLAIGSVVGTVLAVALALVFRPPEMPIIPGFRHWREIASFGTKVVYSNLANQAGQAVPDLIVGRVLGMAPVALLSRANALRNLLLTQVVGILNVTFTPIFGAEIREDKDIRPLFLERSDFVAVMLLPVYAMFIPLCGPLIVLFFGTTWLPAVPIAQVLCAVTLLGLPMVLVTPTLTAKGAVGALAKMHTAVLAMRVLAVAVGSYFGLIYVAALMMLEALAQIVVGGHYTRIHLGVSAWEVYRFCAKSILIAAIAGAVSWLGVSVTPDYSQGELNALWASAVGGFAGLAAAILVTFATGHPAWGELVGMLRQRFGRVAVPPARQPDPE